MIISSFAYYANLFFTKTAGEPESLFNDEEIQLHHKKPGKEGGEDSYSNLQLLHLYCHQQVHSMPARKLCVNA
jgi:5-methylcytosine-specific restriction endonuclease McrA